MAIKSNTTKGIKITKNIFYSASTHYVFINTNEVILSNKKNIKFLLYTGMCSVIAIPSLKQIFHIPIELIIIYCCIMIGMFFLEQKIIFDTDSNKVSVYRTYSLFNLSVFSECLLEICESLILEVTWLQEASDDTGGTGKFYYVNIVNGAPKMHKFLVRFPYKEEIFKLGQSFKNFPQIKFVNKF